MHEGEHINTDVTAPGATLALGLMFVRSHKVRPSCLCIYACMHACFATLCTPAMNRCNMLKRARLCLPPPPPTHTHHHLQNNQQIQADVAARLSLPDTHFLLDYVRPDLLLLRVLSRALVMWDDVAPTRAWVAAQASAVYRVCVVRTRLAMPSAFMNPASKPSTTQHTDTLAQIPPFIASAFATLGAGADATAAASAIEEVSDFDWLR